MQLALIFSLLYFLTFMLHGGLGAYMFYKNPKSPVNRIFFILCISLAIWSFAFSIAVNAPNLETCLFWRRVASAGISVYYCLILHFVILLTNHHWFTEHKKVQIFLYLPVLIFAWVYSLSPTLAPEQYELILTEIGWLKLSLSSFWDYLFNLYFMVYMLIFSKVIWDWYCNTENASEKRQAKMIVSTFGLVFLLVIVTFQIRLHNGTAVFPELACIISLIPVLTCYLAMKKYHLMTDSLFTETNESDLILMGHHKEKVFLYLSSFLMFGGCLYFVSQYLLTGNNFNEVFQFSLLLCLVGFFLKVSHLLIVSIKIKEYISIVIITLLIPIITFRFLNQSSITVWAISLVFILMSVVFNNRWVIAAVALSSLLTQTAVWLLMPNHYTLINNSDHIVRLGLVGFSISLAYYINQLYTMRLKELTEKVHFQKMISNISFELVTINQYNFSEKIKYMLKLSGEIFGSDRCSLYLFNELSNSFSNTHEWCKPGIDSEIHILQDISNQELPWLIGRLQQRESTCIENLDELPNEASVDRANLILRSIQSFAAIPIVNSNRVLGFISLSTLTVKTHWTAPEISHLDILANLVADALSKIDAEKEIERMAYYDHLTGLPNRVLFNDRLSQAIQLSLRTEKLIGVMFLDLDLFKSVNDTIGHEGGDQLLRDVSQRLSNTIRKSDTISRFGGDEFLIIMTNIQQESDIHKISNTIMHIFEEPFMVHCHEFFITASAGVAVYPQDGGDVASLIKHADIALYKAKEQGKNQYLLCSSIMKDEVAEQIRLTNQLYRALERHEFVLYYQPQVNIQSGDIIGVEALIRWQHPEMGMVSPALFIPLAEQTGLINGIGEWVLKTACAQNKAWQSQGLPPIQVAVNLSVQQFRGTDLVELVKNTLADTGLSPKFLELEITESIAIKESAAIISILNELKALGLTIAIDDFGTEYSSLSRVTQLPIDRIKMAIQFVRGIGKNQKDEAIANVIIRLAKNLNVKIIAEGVETREQLDFLKSEMCDEVQGYYYYKPMPADEISAILSKNL